jgi:hypothetical protein
LIIFPLRGQDANQIEELQLYEAGWVSKDDIGNKIMLSIQRFVSVIDTEIMQATSQYR